MKHIFNNIIEDISKVKALVSELSLKRAFRKCIFLARHSPLLSLNYSLLKESVL